MQTTQSRSTNNGNVPWYKDAVSAYDRWVASQDIPVYDGDHIADLKSLELGAWPERGGSAAFLKLAGQDAVSETRVGEIAAGQTLAPVKLGFDELVYVVDGRGLTTVWRDEGEPATSFEWQTHSLFLLPRHHFHQLSNAQGHRPARLLHYNYLPFVMDAVPDISYHLHSNYTPSAMEASPLAELYSEAKAIPRTRPGGDTSLLWRGSFFPDMLAWDKLSSGDNRGFASHLVSMRLPQTPITSHLAVFPPFTYKKAHRHGPGVVIIVLSGEGFSIMWEEGREKTFIPWKAGSVFVPPNRWFHQHFNAGSTPVRYLALHSAPSILGYSERVEDLARDQIEYTDEDPWIRQTFEAELAKRGLQSAMPESIYHDRSMREVSSQG